MTDRDHFAAAALTGLLAQGDDGSFSEESYARSAYRWADAMLSVRDLRTADTKNLDAAPAARADADSARAACWSGLVRRMAAMIAAALAVNEHAGSAARDRGSNHDERQR